MIQKIITGAVAYREKRGGAEWFLVKYKDNKTWELPKSDVRSGESSVSAILRYMKEGLGIKVTVLEEAGRANSTATANGTEFEQRLIFYVMINSKTTPEDQILPGQTLLNVEGEWFTYAAAKRKLGLIREQKMVAQAHEFLKQWQKEKVKRPRKS